MSVEEKEFIEQVEILLHSVDSDFSEVDSKKLLRKIDLRIVPWCAVLYLLSFLDRSNIGNARLYNMEKDLHISDKQYLLAVTVFYLTYSAFEVPSNLILKRTRASWWIAFIMFLWGITTVLLGLSHNYAGLITVRIFLGVFEGGLYPGIAFILSCWYTRGQYGFRIAIFTSAVTLSGAFSGLLAAAISNMDGVGGKAAWAWIFILEGLLTIVIAIATIWVLDDYPETSKFLTPKEKSYWNAYLHQSGKQSATAELFHWKYVYQALSDYKVWTGVMMLVGFDGGLYAFSVFTPSIINALGFRATAANLLTVPIYACAFIVTCFVGYAGDRWKDTRGYFNLICAGIGMAGYIILIASRKPALSYFAVYLAACGIYPTIPNSIAWLGGNIEGPLKRAVVLALAVGTGNLNGAVTSNVYRANDAPWYPLGHGIILVYITIGFSASFAYRYVCSRENTRRKNGKRDEVIRAQEKSGGQEVNGIYETENDARLEKGDNWSQYRYRL